MPLPLDTLILCDTQGDAEAIGAEFRRGGYDVSITWAGDTATLTQSLSTRTFDMVVCDDHITGLDIIAARGLISERGRDVACFIISGSLPMETQRAISQLRGGIDGFIEWGRPERLVPVVETGLRSMESRRRVRQASDDIRHRAAAPPPQTRPNRLPARLGMALAAAIAAIAIASTVMTSKIPDDAMQIVIDNGAAILNDFDTAAGASD